MPLDNKQIKALKGEAHHLKPVVRIGQKGITENLVQETNLALDIHELIKVHISGDDREARRQAAATLANETGSELVGIIGKTFTLYRKRKDEA